MPLTMFVFYYYLVAAFVLLVDGSTERPWGVNFDFAGVDVDIPGTVVDDSYKQQFFEDVCTNNIDGVKEAIKNNQDVNKRYTFEIEEGPYGRSENFSRTALGMACKKCKS